MNPWGRASWRCGFYESTSELVRDITNTSESPVCVNSAKGKLFTGSSTKNFMSGMKGVLITGGLHFLSLTVKRKEPSLDVSVTQSFPSQL